MVVSVLSLLSVLAPSASADQSGVALAEVAYTFAGADDGDVAGFAVTVGDLDGDGIADLAVGAPCHAGGADGGGAVHVVYGPIEEGRPLGSADATLVGGQPGDFVGEALGAADLDGDGDDELLIGAPGPFVGADPVAEGCFQTPVQPGVNRPGEAYVIDGGERLVGNLDAREAAVAVVSGLAPADFLGLGVNGAGDVDGDGDDDLVVGASGPGTPPVGGGSVFLFTDAIDGEVSATSASAQLFGEAPADLAGITIGGADLDGDGGSDLLVSAPGNALPPSRPGRVYLFHEPPSGAHGLGAADVVLEGEVADDFAGRGLATGDLIGDASPDVAIGAPGTGTVFVLSGGERRSGIVALADAPVRIEGPAGGSSGYALAVVDLDGDGARELAVGRPATGAGDEPGAVAVFEAPEGQLAFADADVTYRGTPGDNAGFSVAAGDLNGDGIQDLVIGAASIDGGGPGAAYVVPGSSLPGRSGDAQRRDPPRPPGHAVTEARASSTLPVTGGSASLGVPLLLAGAVLARANSASVRLREPTRPASTRTGRNIMRNRTFIVGFLLAALTLLPSIPAAAVVDGAQPLAADVPSKVWLDLYETGELDSLRVRAGGQSSDLYGDPGTWICISAERSSVRTEFRRGYEYEITTEQREHGCAEDIRYRFDQTAWRANVTVTVPTTLHTTVGERGPYGWELIEGTEESATAIVRLRWVGVGDQRVDTWIDPPSICYTFPPTPCFYGAGVTSSRAADVTGRIRLEGSSQELHIATTRWAGMRWWAGR